MARSIPIDEVETAAAPSLPPRRGPGLAPGRGHRTSSGLIPRVLVMVYGPRDDHELEVAWHLVQLSRQFALGSLAEHHPPNAGLDIKESAE